MFEVCGWRRRGDPGTPGKSVVETGSWLRAEAGLLLRTVPRHHREVKGNDPGRHEGRLRSAVDRVGAICGRFRIDSLAPQLAACGELLRGAGWWTSPCWGSSRREELVPQRADRRRRRACRRSAVHGRGHPDRVRARERVSVHGLAGEESEIPLARLAEFVTERGNPANEKRISLVDVELPILAAFEGIRFVDTPGLGSVFAHNTRVSKEWMPAWALRWSPSASTTPFPKTTCCSSTMSPPTPRRRPSC